MTIIRHFRSSGASSLLGFFHDHDHEFTIWTITCEASGRYPEQFFPETSSDIAQDNRGQTLIDYLVSHFIHLIFGGKLSSILL